MLIEIQKSARRLILRDEDGKDVFSCKIALGSSPLGPKEKEGDGKTPEGEYFVCLKKEGKYGPSLGVSYPSEADARRSGAPDAQIACIRERAEKNERPPWGTALGGEIYIHGGGTETDWTAGCVALSDADAQTDFDLVPLGARISIKE